MFEKFYPKEFVPSAYGIDYKDYYKKGYRGILYDVDNTLVEHNEPVTDRAIQLFKDLKDMGFKVCIISNNKEPRVKPLADTLGSHYVYKAGKPLKRGYEEGMKHMGTDKDTTLFVGDQLFTDVYGANRAGIYSILVEPIGKEIEIQIKFKRKLEKIVMFFYKRRNNK